MSPDETRLIMRAKRGDKLALGSLARWYERHLYAVGLAELRSSWDAQDAVQETLTEACAHIQSLKDPQRFRAWLTRILLNKCSRLRAASRPAGTLDEVPSGAWTFVGTELDDEVIRAVAALPERQRTVVALHYFFDLTYGDIELATGWPVGTVKSSLHRGLSRLRVTLTAQRNASGL